MRTLVAVVGLALTGCGGTSSVASTGEFDSAVDATGVAAPSSDPATTLPALLDPSTDIEAIESPVVLWFWSPG